MPELRKVCDIYQGYNFKKDKQSTVGFITSLTIGGTAITADQTVKDPLKPTDDLKAAVVLSDVLWELGVTDALYFSGQVSVYNKQVICGLIINDLTKIDVVFQYTIYEYDPVAKVYFKCFHCNATDMNGILEKRGDDLNLTVADDMSTQVQSPENYAFSMGVKPQPSAQTLTISTSSTKNVVKSWGMTVTG